MTYKLTVTTLALTAITSTVAATHAKPDTEHPHIVLILCDDMGFSDLSCYGGEINTTAACMEGEAITNQIPFIIICNGLPSFRMIITIPPLSQTLPLVLSNNIPRRLPCSCT